MSRCDINMSISNKIKGLLKIKNKKSIDYTTALNLSSPTTLNNKYVRESFKVQDLIVLANLTGTKLAFIDENDKPVIVFDKEDLEDKKKPRN